VRDHAVVAATTVVNLSGHRDDPDFADVVYVGRAMYRGGWRLGASPLANPYRVGRDGSRGEVVARYRDYLLGRPDLLALLPELRGRRIGCWCAPQACHADVIAELAEDGGGLGASG
jgi:GNAT superfamily N-acetyltransferase